LTGGLGAGKSTVATMLAEHGAIIIDADRLAREVVSRGTVGFDAVLDRFGPDMVGADGELDRARLAGIVFADPGARDDLNAIVHPLVRQRAAQVMAAAPPDAIVVYDVPLLAETDGGADFDVVVVVEADIETRLRRLAERGLPEEQARSRIAAQASDEQRRAIAHELLRNDGSRESLAAQVDELWRRLQAHE
jgi:dephospho-CoA kinase